MIVCGNINHIQIFRDKRKTNSFFKSINIKVPQEYSLEDIQFPVFIKPIDGSSKDLFIADSMDSIPQFTVWPRVL